MLFTMMIGQLSETAPLTEISAGCCQDIHDVALIDGTQKVFSKETLYFGMAGAFPGDSLPPQCVLACTENSRWTTENAGNLALCSPDHLFRLFNKGKSILDASAGRGLYGELMDCAARSRSIEPVINLAAARLNNSVILLDSEYKVLSHSTVFPIDDPLWEENIEKGYCSYEFVSAVQEIPEVRDAKMTSDPVVVTCQASPLRKLSSKIFIDHKYTGILLMLEKESPITPEQIELLPVISAAAADAMARYAPFLIPSNTAYEKKLYNLLIGAPSEEASDWGSLSASTHFAALCIRQSRYLGQKYLRQEVSRVLLSRFPEIRFTYHEGGIAAVLPLGENPVVSDDVLRLLELLAGEYHLHIGVSGVFLQLDYFAKRYMQARRALELASRLKRTEPVTVYTDLSFYDLLDHVQDRDQMGSFCHPALFILNRYDAKHGTDLYLTLETFLFCDGILKDTAEKLFIHRNSLRYRMERIEELTGVDLSRGDVRFLLLMSYRIDRFIGNDGE